jgi:hypothetical protein
MKSLHVARVGMEGVWKGNEIGSNTIMQIACTRTESFKYLDSETVGLYNGEL